MALQPGTKIGPYEVLAPVGTGGQGEIYKAADPEQRRTVAIRILPPHFCEDPELKQRFKLEMQTIASLKHPHICALYDVAHEDGTDFVLMEYLEGETLAERLMRGALPLEEALQVAIAMADALDKAHRQGVTHRGLAPSNVMLTPSGAKLLDFGLVKPQPSSQSSVSSSMLPTASGTMPAAVAGATEYMAPEQLEGKDSDARTDIFTFGAILYEMVTGKKSFEGKTPMLLAAAILTADPEPLSKLQPMAPSALDYLVNRCLAKDPKLRVQTAWDLMGQLQWIVERGSLIGVPAPVAAHRRKRERLVWRSTAIALLLAGVLALPAYRYVQGPGEPREVHFVIPSIGLTPGNGASTPPLISPNGRWIAASRGNTRGLDALSVGSVTLQVLLPEQAVGSAFWSPDNRSIGFFEDGKFKKADVSGGPSVNICEAAVPLGGASWSTQGVIVFSSGGLLYRVLAAGGQPVAITALDQSQQESEHLAPYFLPDGRHYLYLALSAKPSNSAIYVGELDSKERTRLFASDSRAVYAAPGYILFNRENTVFAQPFDQRKLALTGEAIRIADGVPYSLPQIGVSSAGLARSVSFAASNTGVLAYRTGANSRGGLPTNANPGTVPDLTLVWFDRSGTRTGQAGTPGGYAGIDLSPDGKQVAVHRHEGEGGDTWILEAAPGTVQPQRLTFDANQDNLMPVWSPDGKQIAFGSRRNGKWGLYVKPADGATNEQLLVESDVPKAPMSWSPDGKLLVYEVTDPQARGDVWAIPLSGEKKPFAVLQTQANERIPQVSPDGKWIAYQSDQTGRAEIYIQPFPSGPGRWQVSTDGGSFPRWRRDAKELYFYEGQNLMAAEVRVSGSSVQPGGLRSLFGINNPNFQANHVDYLRYAVSADGQRFLVPQPGALAAGGGGLADTIATLADQGGTPTTGTNSITVVLNWPSILKQK